MFVFSVLFVGSCRGVWLIGYRGMCSSSKTTVYVTILSLLAYDVHVLCTVALSCVIREAYSFQRVLCTGFNGVGT